MRSDLQRLKDMVLEFEEPHSKKERAALEVALLRELLTSWQALTEFEYQTDERLHLNMLTKRMLANG